MGRHRTEQEQPARTAKPARTSVPFLAVFGAMVIAAVLTFVAYRAANLNLSLAGLLALCGGVSL